MKKLLVVGMAAAIATMAHATSFAAGCGSVCRQKCQATAQQGNMSVAECIRVWDRINREKGVAGAAALEGKVGHSIDGKKRVITRESDDTYKPYR